MQGTWSDGKDINADIAALVQDGLTERVQKALDTVRVIGNKAVHPGTLDFRDEPAIAGALVSPAVRLTLPGRRDRQPPHHPMLLDQLRYQPGRFRLLDEVVQELRGRGM